MILDYKWWQVLRENYWRLETGQRVWQTAHSGSCHLAINRIQRIPRLSVFWPLLAGKIFLTSAFHYEEAGLPYKQFKMLPLFRRNIFSLQREITTSVGEIFMRKVLKKNVWKLLYVQTPGEQRNLRIKGMEFSIRFCVFPQSPVEDLFKIKAIALHLTLGSFHNWIT